MQIEVFPIHDVASFKGLDFIPDDAHVFVMSTEKAEELYGRLSAAIKSNPDLVGVTFIKDDV